MSIHSVQLSSPPRLAASLALSLGLPVALALCMLFRNDLGLPNALRDSDCRQQSDEACEEANSDRDIPATPRPEMDGHRIYVARLQYHYLVHCRRLSQTLLHSAHSLKQRHLIAQEIALGDEDYRRAYHQVTREGRRRAHLPAPDDSPDNLLRF